MRQSIDPRFNGHLMFGPRCDFVCLPLTGTPGSIDAWLGHAPGTALGVPQQCWAVSGLLTGPTSAAVQAAIDFISAQAAVDASFGYPTGARQPGVNFVWAPMPCYFLPQEFVPAAISAQAGNRYAAQYRMVIRST